MQMQLSIQSHVGLFWMVQKFLQQLHRKGASHPTRCELGNVKGGAVEEEEETMGVMNVIEKEGAIVHQENVIVDGTVREAAHTTETVDIEMAIIVIDIITLMTATVELEKGAIMMMMKITETTVGGEVQTTPILTIIMLEMIEESEVKIAMEVILVITTNRRLIEIIIVIRVEKNVKVLHHQSEHHKKGKRCNREGQGG